MKIGVFGGSFDPIHFGHLILAEQAREQANLDEFRFVPTARHPLKTDRDLTSFDDRKAMLEIAIAEQNAFSVDTIENQRTGMSYTAETLDEFARRDPGAELFLVLGGDCVLELPSWREPQRIVKRATLLAKARPGSPIPTIETLRASLQLPENMPLRLVEIDVPLIDLSSRDIRRRVASGQSIRFMLPAGVEQYIHRHGLYNQSHTSSKSR